MKDAWENVKETLLSVGPVIVIIYILQACFAPMSRELLARFAVGSVLLVIGLAIFNMGVSTGMEPMGAEIGAGMAKSRKLWIIVVTGFIIGFTVTLAEPDLQVLTGQVNVVSQGAISYWTLMLSVAAGVGFMVVIALLRILFQWPLRRMLWIAYGIIFIIAASIPQAYVPIAFDSGGVTTGPMTVPFIMALGIGVSHIRSDRTAEADSFGLVGLVSAGPILSVLVLGALIK